MGIIAQIFDSASGRDSLSVWPPMASDVLVINAAGPFERAPGQYAVKLLPGHGRRGTVRAVPVDAEGKEIAGTMKGYSFISSSDSRFRELCEQITGAPFYGAVALHDRLEQQCAGCNSFTPVWKLNPVGQCPYCVSKADQADERAIARANANQENQV